MQGRDATLVRLQAFLNSKGFDDEEIRRGIEFKPEGYAKIAKRMGVSDNEARGLVNSLIAMVRDENKVAEAYTSMMEDDARFGFEKDGLGNITIHDAKTGQAVFLRGTKAGEVLAAIQSGQPEQQVLARYAGGELTEDATDDSYEDEVATDRGTYNFPWKTEAGHGTATAEYSGKGNIRIISVRDEEGGEIDADEGMLGELVRQAVNFIGEA